MSSLLSGFCWLFRFSWPPFMHMHTELDTHTTKLITLFREKAAKTGKIAEECGKLVCICDLQSADGPDLTDTPVALLTVVWDDTTDAAILSPESISIVARLFGYIYALELKYPKNLKLTFTFIQKVVMSLEDNKTLKGHLLMLKNDLFSE